MCGVLSFLVTPVLRFALLPYYQWTGWLFFPTFNLVLADSTLTKLFQLNHWELKTLLELEDIFDIFIAYFSWHNPTKQPNFHEKPSAKKLQLFQNHTSKYCSVYAPTLFRMYPRKSYKFSLGYININQFIKFADVNKHPNTKNVVCWNWYI